MSTDDKLSASELLAAMRVQQEREREAIEIGKRILEALGAGFADLEPGDALRERVETLMRCFSVLVFTDIDSDGRLPWIVTFATRAAHQMDLMQAKVNKASEGWPSDPEAVMIDLTGLFFGPGNEGKH